MSYTRERMLLGDRTGDGLWVHCISRCVRKAFLAGDGFSHRKDLIEKRLRLLAEHAAVEVASYAVMSNHLHVVLRVRGDWAAQWDAESVVRRYYTVFPKSRDAQEVHRRKLYGHLCEDKKSTGGNCMDTGAYPHSRSKCTTTDASVCGGALLVKYGIEFLTERLEW